MLSRGTDGALLLGRLLVAALFRRTCEFEDVRQFGMRGAIRRPDYGGDYDFYVYDRAQAEDFEAYLKENGISECVELVPVHEAGIMDVIRPQPRSTRTTRQPSVASTKARRNEDADRKRQDRARTKEKAIANGTYRGPGRPSKVRQEAADSCCI